MAGQWTSRKYKIRFKFTTEPFPSDFFCVFCVFLAVCGTALNQFLYRCSPTCLPLLSSIEYVNTYVCSFLRKSILIFFLLFNACASTCFPCNSAGSRNVLLPHTHPPPRASQLSTIKTSKKVAPASLTERKFVEILLIFRATLWFLNLQRCRSSASEPFPFPTYRFFCSASKTFYFSNSSPASVIRNSKGERSKGEKNLLHHRFSYFHTLKYFQR